MDEPRLQRIEESIGFVERQLEELHDHVLSLQRHLDSLRRRVEATEGKVTRLEQPPPEHDAKTKGADPADAG